MKNYLTFKTQSGNHYLYSYHKNRVLFLHPLLAKIIKKSESQEQLKDWLQGLKEQNNPVDNSAVYSKKEILYYHQKFLWLKDNGFFTVFKTDFSATVTAEGVESQIANLRQLTFEVTDNCNLKCEYCGYGKFYDDYDQRTRKNLDVETAIELLNYLSELWNSPLNKSQGKKVYISFYGGEPLLNMDFIETVVNYINRGRHLHNRFIFSMTTNGLLIEKHMDFLVKNNIFLLISLDGDEGNNAYRIYHNSKEAYKGIIQNIDSLQKKHPAYFDKYVNFNAVLHNKNSVNDIYTFFKKRYNKSPSIGELNNAGIKPDMIEEFNKTYRNVNESLFQSENYDEITKEMFIQLPNIQSTGIFLNQYTPYLYKDFTHFFVDGRKQKRLPTGTCFPFGKRMFVTVNGKILPCERIGHQFSLGQISKDRIDINYSKIADSYNAFYDKMKTLCQNCYISEACMQCIFNLPTIESDVVKCTGFTIKDDFIDYLSSQMFCLEREPGTYTKIMKEVTIE